MAGMTVARLGVDREKNRVASLKICSSCVSFMCVFVTRLSLPSVCHTTAAHFSTPRHSAHTGANQLPYSQRYHQQPHGTPVQTAPYRTLNSISSSHPVASSSLRVAASSKSQTTEGADL